MAQINDLKKLYNDVRNQPRELFIKSLMHFREIMCSTKYTPEQKDNAFTDLITDYFRCNLRQEDITHFQAVKLEWEMRRRYEPFSTFANAKGI